MNIVNNSLTIVLIADWNKLYTQPDWVANNIFCQPEMEIGIETQGSEFIVSYKCGSIVINPSQDKVIITAADIRKETIGFLIDCANNYIKKAIIPYFSAYGFNIDFVETESTLLSEIFDSISDSQAFIGLGYEIENSQIDRRIVKSNKVMNVEFTQESNLSKIHFNEHYEETETQRIVLNCESIENFIGCAKEIAIELGFEFDGEEDE